jgi:methyl-accepting chemotaxis protein
MLGRLNIRARFALASVVLCTLAGLLAFTGYWQIHSLRAQVDDIPELLEVRLVMAGWQGETAANAARTVAILRSDDPELAGALALEMKAASARISELQKRIEALPLDEASKKRFAAIGAARAAYVTARDDTLKIKQQSSDAAHVAFDARFAPALADYQKAVQEFIEGYAAEYREEHAAARRAAGRGVTGLAAGTVAFMVIAALLVWLISRSIIVPVGEAVRVAEALAKGDLTQKVETGSKDEIGRLMHALKGTVGQLASIVGRIKETSDMVGTASREIAQGNTDLSTRTEEQASALEETSASMQQMTATVGQNAQNAKKVNELAAQASGVAAKGGEVVREAVGTMNGITQSSKKIADIIGVIDGIAFQTNILALNAAVEAARAGEQGRGFAVVASEVRSLAQRSAAAAKEIKDLITDSVSKVDAGSRQVNDAGRTMEEIVASVKKVTTLISEITAASQEQAQGIEQVSETMTQLEKVTQQNAAMVEEASAAAGSLEEQSRELASAVGAFTLAEQHGLVAPAPKHVAPKAAERKPAEKTESKKRVEVKTPHIHTLAAKVSAKKGNGHLEEGWQEF